MEAADVLCDSLFCWLENRKKCAGKLEKLAQKLKGVHQGSNTGQAALGTGATVGLISGAVIGTALTRDQTRDKASTLETATTAGTLAGAAVSVIYTLVEKLITSSAFNKATELIKEDEKVGRSIQNLLRDLKVRCRETLKDRCAEAPLGTHADELDCEVTTLLMWALARRSNTPVSLDFLRGFNMATLFRHMTPGGLDPAEATHFICQALGAVNFLVLGKKMMKNIELIGIKASNKAGSEGATGLGMCLRDLIVKTKELVKGDQVTEASEFLRDSAREILEDQQKLKEQLDAMHKIIQKLLQMKNLIKNLGGYSLSIDEKGQRIIDYIMGTCTDSRVLSWLQGLPHQIEFVNLVRFFKERLTDSEYLTTSGRGHIDIVFVGHGRIDDQFMPAGGLVPTDNIRDTILYSPWNCAIDGDAACGIAEGFIEVRDRQFYNNRSTANCKPKPLPDHWNSMRRSLHDIPVILLAPVTPEDGAWDLFQQFWMNRMELEDRVIIPYLVPKCLVNAFGEIPLYMLIFVTSFILMLYGKTATVHLAAFLGRGRGTPSSEERVRQEWERQERERQERERQERERQERERQQKEIQERERQERERQQRERQERERQERERQERERQERERQQREKPAWFRPKRERQAWERQVKERQEREIQERERQERERQERERQERERQERERQERERQERERQQRERQERERQQRERQEWERQEKERQEWLRKKWRAQYAYTSDGVWMSVKMDNRNVDLLLFRALRSMLNTNL